MSAAPFMQRLERRMENKRQRAKTISDSVFGRREQEARAFVEAGDWSRATPAHFVALYAIGHLNVYGVEPGELTPPLRLAAAGAAARMLQNDFGGDAGKMHAFVRWTWERELEREQWRRDNGREGGRISWRLQFSRAIWTDWRLDLARKSSRR